MIIKVNSEILSRLTNTEKQVIEYINNNDNKLIKMSIVDVAEETYTSPATVSRAIKKAGIDGFSQLRYLISKESNGDSDSGQVNEIINKSLIETTNTIERISVEDILKTVNLIKNSSRIYVLSRGLTELVGEEFTLKLQLLGYNGFSIKDPNIMMKMSGSMKKNELLFAFSLYGKTPEIINSAENAVSLGCKVISCCCGEDTKLEKLSSIYLNGYKDKNISIKKFEVTSRLPLTIISRIIIDYLSL
ncbi:MULTISPECIES: MurR/RpiR family transcriptional regulator [Clostridium]|uniref:MurR/RpiR family transcriptional regulator n=1 Tax=Clostridium TaxID=1485 RepID=UPI00082680BB|nr:MULTISPECIES: MurR/RpiR family transcriptional regulator [Clostridium]PJI08411.1 MurR/RpiR family transcriptional regulator [Clostridium sp. CT7]